MASKTQFVFPPDAGSTNSGATPSISNCGRGIPRTGDIRHKGDNIPSQGAAAQTGIWPPGTIGQNVVVPVLDSVSGAIEYDQSFDGEAAPGAFNSAGSFGGLDASGEGFDPFSSKQGRQA